MLLREAVLLSLTLSCLDTGALQDQHNHSHICRQWTRLENWPRLTHIGLVFFFCLDSFTLGQVSCLLLYKELHNTGCFHRRDNEEEQQVNPPAQQQSIQFIPAPSHRRSTGRGSTLGQFCQTNILQLNPSQHELSESNTRHRWILHETSVTLTLLALIAEKQLSTWAFPTFTVSIHWDRQQKSDLKAKREIATSEVLCHHFLNYSSSYKSYKKN